MVETFTPAVCGSRQRQRLALAGFAVAAIAASALMGASLGALGAALGAQLALVAAGLALLAAAREAGLVSFPLPQVRRQVPERWRFELPLPVWSVGYGAGLGVGFLTFQPVATFWVACAAAVALANPLVAAACFASFGAGRALMAAWPRRGHDDATAAVESLVGRRRFLLAANVVVLILCAALLAAPSAGAATSLGPGFDPSVRGSVLGRAQMSSGVSSILLQPEGESAVTIPSGSAPSVDGDLVAYADSQGVKVVNWRTGAPVTQIDGAVAKPALDWPLLAFVRTGSTYRRLIVADYTDLAAPTKRLIAKVRVRNDLGRPSLVAGRIAWHKVTSVGSVIYVQVLATGKRTVMARSPVALLVNPSLSSTRVVWVAEYPRACTLRTRRFDSHTVERIYRTTSTTRLLWTTALTGRTAYVAQWSLKTGASTLVRVNF